MFRTLDDAFRYENAILDETAGMLAILGPWGGDLQTQFLVPACITTVHFWFVIGCSIAAPITGARSSILSTSTLDGAPALAVLKKLKPGSKPYQ
jgi:hypothetical protein